MGAMTRFAIDPQTLLHLAEIGYELDTTHQLVAPNAIRPAAMELLLRKVRKGEITESRALEIHEFITALKIRALGDRVSRRVAWDLAREHDWESTRLAEYLSVAKLQADVLVALDPELVAIAAGIVPLAPVSALLPR